MAYHFLNTETSEYYYCDEKEWAEALEIAKDNYWEPDGTFFDSFYEAADMSFDTDELTYFYFMLIGTRNEAEYWDGSYLTKKNQVVLYDDAYYMAQSLDGTGVNPELIEFIRKGSFRICSE